MVKIDVKDRRILYQLDLDSRQSFRSIGRKVGLTKDVVASRVKKLQDNGVIIRFYALLDQSRLGLTFLRLYFKYQYVTPSIKKEIIDHFVNYDYSISVSSQEGSYDLGILMLVKNVTDIYPFWRKTLDKFGDYFADRFFSVYAEESYYRCSILLDEKDDRTKLGTIGGGRKVETDDLDFQILKILSHNTRIPTIEIAQKLNSTAITINNRIKGLMESRIIRGFRVEIDFNKLGYQWFKVDLYLKEYSKIHPIIKYMETNPHLYYVDNTIGYADLELELLLKNVNQLHQIIDNISNKFPKTIRNYTYFHIIESHKFEILDMKQIQI